MWTPKDIPVLNEMNIKYQYQRVKIEEKMSSLNCLLRAKERF